MILPIEILEKILILLSAETTYRIAVQLNLTYVRNQCLPRVSRLSIDEASRKGIVQVLDWWSESGHKFSYTNGAMDCASVRGHIEVLEWWKTSGLELKYSELAMDRASENGHIAVLEWWKACGLKLIYSNDPMEMASVLALVAVSQTDVIA